MIGNTECSIPLDIRHLSTCRFRADVLCGLGRPAKELPCKYFYDETGSELFEQITQLPEYYPTRTELAIMQRYASEMADLLGRRCLLIEYGSGNSAKTKLLLDHVHDLAGYVPVDISARYLKRSAQALAQQYPQFKVLPLCADFTRTLELPTPPKLALRRVVYFPGSTLGNFTPAEASALLGRTARLCGQGGALLLGVDLRKDPQVIEAAYNDTQGVTAAFNRNLLVRINRELAGDFAVERFRHHAFYDVAQGRIEMHLISSNKQWAHVGEAAFFFAAGESIRTEYSCKYSLDHLRKLAAASGWAVQRVWMDDRNFFAVSYLTVIENHLPAGGS
jgi:L-histidine N-alpha-methyltransferase